jgi:hypothetical protein
MSLQTTTLRDEAHRNGGIRRDLLHRWPSALGLAVAAVQLASGPDTETVATVVGVAVLCYLGAAALGRRWVAWAGCVVFGLVVVASQAVGLPWWAVGAGVALVLIGAGLLLRVPAAPLTAQAAALAGFGGAAAVALLFAPRVGLILGGLALAGHAVWDVIHFRRNQVVPRSLAEFCILLDVPLGVGAIVLAITTG